jgi:hypothetical protein
MILILRILKFLIRLIGSYQIDIFLFRNRYPFLYLGMTRGNL